MKKGFFKTFAAIATAAMMTLGMATAASAASGSWVEGTGDVTDIVYQVDVPRNFIFPINVYEAATPSEIVVSNRTKNAPGVLVSLDLTVRKATEVEIATPGQIKGIGFDQNTTKNIYLAILGAQGVTSGTATTPGQLDNIVWDFATKGELVAANYATGSELVPFVATGGEYKAYVDFALGKPVYAGDVFQTFATGESGTEGFAAFGFYSEVNSGVVWADGDVSVSGNFTFTGINEGTYAAIQKENTAGFLGAGVNQVHIPEGERPSLNTATKAEEEEPEEPEEPVYETAGFIVGDATVGTLTTSVSLVNGGYIDIPFFADGATITSIKVASGTDVKGDSAIADNSLRFEPSTFSSTGSKPLTMRLSNGTDYKFTVVVTAS